MERYARVGTRLSQLAIAVNAGPGGNDVAIGPQPAAGNRVPAIERALVLLRHLRERPCRTLAQLSRELQVPKTTLYRVLTTLAAHRVVTPCVDGGGYRLGNGLRQLVDGVSLSDDLAFEVGVHLRRLSARLDETAKFTVRESMEVFVMAVEQSPKEYSITAQLGRRLPLHAGAASKVLLAHMPRREFEAYVTSGLRRFTESTVTDPLALQEQLGCIRRQGWAHDAEEYIVGVRAFAAPVRDFDDRVVGAISVPYLSGATSEREEAIRGAVTSAANDFSRELGHDT